MRLLPKSIHWCRRYPTKFNSGRDIPHCRAGCGRVERKGWKREHLARDIERSEKRLEVGTAGVTRVSTSVPTTGFV